MPDNTSQTNFEQNRAKAYADLAITASATSDALSGNAVNHADLKSALEKNGQQVIEGGKAKNIWDVYNTVLETAKSQGQTPDSLFQDVVGSDGVTRKVGNLAIDVDGKIFHAQVEFDANNPEKIRTQLGTYSEVKGPNGENTYEVKPFTDKPISVARENGKIIANLADMSPEQKLAQFGDRDYKLHVAQDMFAPMSHQTKPILALAGIEHTPDGYKQIPDFEAKQAQLVTAGTGTGKTAIIAGYAQIKGEGILAVPENLVSDMVKDGSKFIGQVPATIAKEQFAEMMKEPEKFKQFMADNKYVVLSHDQLLEASPHIKDRSVFVDESHELTMNKNGTHSPERTAQLKGVLDNNRAIAVTATPTPELYNLMGKEVSDVSLYKAQYELKSVRQVDTQDKVVGKAGENNIKALTDETLLQTIGRETTLTAENKGYTPPEAVGGNADLAAQKNTIRASQVQGMVFSDNPEVTKGVATAINQIREGTYKDIDALQAKVSEMRGGKPVDLRAEMNQAQQRNIASAINAEVISELDSNNKLKDLQADSRKGSDLSKHAEKLTSSDIPAEKFDEVKAKFNDIAAKHPELKPYYDRAIQVVDNIQAKNSNPLVKGSDIDLKQVGAVAAVEIPKAATTQQIGLAKEQLNRGLAHQFVSEGALGTGYSNPNVLNTVVVESKEHSQGDAMTRSQQLGRPIRDKDGKAMAAVVVDANIPAEKRNPITASVAVGGDGAKAATVYREAVTVEAKMPARVPTHTAQPAPAPTPALKPADVSTPTPTPKAPVVAAVAGETVNKATNAVESFAGSKTMSQANMISGGIQAVSSFAQGDNVGAAAGVAQTAAGAYADSLSAAGKASGAAKANIVGGVISAGVEGYQKYQETGDLGQAALASAKSVRTTALTAGAVAVAPTVAGGVVTTVTGSAATGAAATAATGVVITAASAGMAVTAAAVGGYAIGNAIDQKAGISSSIEKNLEQDMDTTNNLSPRFGKGADITGYRHLNAVNEQIKQSKGITDPNFKATPEELKAQIEENKVKAQELDGGGVTNWLKKTMISGEDLSEKGKELKRQDSAGTELKIYEKKYNQELAAKQNPNQNTPAQPEKGATAEAKQPEPEKQKTPEELALDKARAQGAKVGLKGLASSDGKNISEGSQVSAPQVNAPGKEQQRGSSVA